MRRQRHAIKTLLSVSALLVTLVGAAAPTFAQPATEHTPNIEGTWVTPEGTAFFAFLHRLTVGAPPTYTVGNIPMFHLSGGLNSWLSAGALYATETVTVPGASQELELFAKQLFLNQDEGAPLSLSLKEAFNTTALSPDAELSASRRFGPMTLFASARALGNYRYTGAFRTVGALGASWQLTPYLHLAGDVAASPTRLATEPPLAWGAGAQMAIPYTPHTLSLQVTNTGTSSIHGASVPTNDLRFGFDFTVLMNNAGQWLEIFKPAAGQDEPAPGTPAEAPPASASPRFDAKAFYTSNCAGCHGAAGEGGFASNLQSVEAKDDAFIAMRVAKGSPKGMPAYGSKLTAAEMTMLVDYVKGL